MLRTGRMSSGADGGVTRTATGGCHRRFCLRGPACRAAGGSAKPGRGASAGYHRNITGRFPYSLGAHLRADHRQTAKAGRRGGRWGRGAITKPDTGRMSLDTPPLGPRPAPPCPQFGPAPAYRAVPQMLTVRPAPASVRPAPAYCAVSRMLTVGALRLLTVRPCACSLSASRGVAGDVARRGIGIAGRVRIARWCGAPIRGLAQPEMTSESPLAVAGRTAARDPRPRRGCVCSLTADAGRPNPEVVVLSNDYCECLIPAWALSSIRIDIQPPHQRRAEQGLAR
jgi:hypothetical protein